MLKLLVLLCFATFAKFQEILNSTTNEIIPTLPVEAIISNFSMNVSTNEEQDEEEDK